MKTTTDDVFRLIKSMSGHEKRYFKLFSSVYERDKNYTKLFDVLDKLDGEYNEQKIINELKNDTWITQLPKIKHRLYFSLLNSLELYQKNSNDTVEIKLTHLLLQARILFEKGLNKQCEKLLKKIKQEAYLYEKYESVLTIIHLEKLVNKNHVDIENILRETETNTAIINRINTYNYLQRKLYALHVSKGEISSKNSLKREMDNVMKHPLLLNEKKAITYIEKYYYFIIYTLYYGMIVDFDKSLFYSDKLICFMESKPYLTMEYKSRYLVALGNLLVCYVRLNKLKESKAVFNKISVIHKASKSAESANQYVLAVSNLIVYYLQQKNLQKGIELLNKSFAEEIFSKFNQSIPEITKVTYYFNVFHLYFGVKDYKKALAYLNRIIHDTDMDVREDAQCITRILSLIVYYEMGEQEVMSNYVKSINRFLSKRNYLHKFEKIFFEFICKKLLLIANKQELKIAFVNFKIKLEQLFKNPKTRQALVYFDFLSWIESKIKEQSPLGKIQQKISKKST